MNAITIAVALRAQQMQQNKDFQAPKSPPSYETNAFFYMLIFLFNVERKIKEMPVLENKVAQQIPH